MNSRLLTICLCFFSGLFFTQPTCAQYLGVKARYSETRLVADPPYPPYRENRLILSFYHVGLDGTYSPVSISGQDIWIQPQGFQYGSLSGGVQDSTGNNYPDYPWTAPRVVAYYNSLGPGLVECDASQAIRFVANGHELDCGFIPVSHWESAVEYFTAPNVHLPYYFWPDPYAILPGNVNFSFPFPPTAPYNWYDFYCSGTQQLIIRGVLAADTANIVTLPVRLANVSAQSDDSHVTLRWSNLAEEDVAGYTIERSTDGNHFTSIDALLPSRNDGSRADYQFNTIQPSSLCFYRIRATEYNGTYTYSIVLPVQLQGSAGRAPSSLSIHPNPSGAAPLTVRLTGAAPGRYLLRVLNADGQYVTQQMIDHASGDLQRVLDLTRLPAGIYTLVLQSTTERFTKQLIHGQSLFY